MTLTTQWGKQCKHPQFTTKKPWLKFSREPGPVGNSKSGVFFHHPTLLRELSFLALARSSGFLLVFLSPQKQEIETMAESSTKRSHAFQPSNSGVQGALVAIRTLRHASTHGLASRALCKGTPWEAHLGVGEGYFWVVFSQTLLHSSPGTCRAFTLNYDSSSERSPA